MKRVQLIVEQKRDFIEELHCRKDFGENATQEKLPADVSTFPTRFLHHIQKKIYPFQKPCRSEVYFKPKIC